MNKQPFKKRLLAALLAATLLVGTGVVGLYAMAASKVTVQIANIPRDSDKESSNSNWGHPELKLMNGWVIHKETYFTVKVLDDYTKGDAVYCIEPASSLHTGDELDRQSAAETFFTSIPYNGTLNGDWQRKLIAAILYYGYQGTCDLTGWVTQNSSGRANLAKYWATQLLVWESIIGERGPNFERVSVPSGYVSIDTFVMDGNPIRSDIFSAMSAIEAKVKATLLSPSFVEQDNRKQQTFTLKYDSSSGQFTTTLTDTNGVLANWEFSAPGITVTKSGNNLVLTSDKALPQTVTLTATRKISDSSSLVVWGDGSYVKDGSGKQDLVAYGSPVSETLEAWAKLESDEAPTTTSSTTQSTTKSTTQPTTQSTTKSTTKSTTSSTTQSTTQSTTKSTTSSTTQSTTKSTTKSTTSSTTQPTTQSTTQSTTKPTTESTTQSTTQPTTQNTTQSTTAPTTVEPTTTTTTITRRPTTTTSESPTTTTTTTATTTTVPAPAPTTTTTAAPTTTKRESNVPDTGDHTKPLLWVGIAVLALGAGAVVAWRRREA